MKTKKDQLRIVNPLLLLILAIAGILLFIIISQMAPFKEFSLFGNLYDKPPVDAAGRGKGGKILPATLTVSPGTLYSGGNQYSVTGSGFRPSQMVAFSIADPGCCLAFNLWSDASGNVSFTRSTGDPGTYKIDAFQLNNRKYTLMGTVSFSVLAP